MTIEAGGETIRALATVTLDAQALDELGPKTLDRLADLVAQRLQERRAAGEAPLLSAVEAARVARVHTETVRRAIRLGDLAVAGYVGQRPRLRREDVEAWVAAGRGPVPPSIGSRAVAPLRRAAPRRVLGDALRALSDGEAA